MWLCGYDTVNINPEEPMRFSLAQMYGTVKRHFDVRIKSQLAIIFNYKAFEVSLFNGGRMLIKNVKDEKTAMKVYREIADKLKLS